MKGVARVPGTVAIGLALLATAARAQSSWPRPVTVGGGLSFSRSSGITNRGFDVRVDGTRALTDKPVWFRSGLAVDDFVSFHVYTLEADVGCTFTMTGAYGSYLFGGPQATGTNTLGESGWGANVGGGLTFPLANRIGYLEVRYVWSGVLGFEMIPVTLGIGF